MVYDVVVVGGGASGFFTAIEYARRNPNKEILILERSKEVLSKVRISGGGRCNVTHADFIPQSLVKNYPRGQKELLSPFHQFMTGDVMEWFENRGVSLKIEEDNRVFPISDSSQSIIDCFLKEKNRLSIELKTQQNVKNIRWENQQWHIETLNDQFLSHQLVIATGSNPKIWQLLSELGHTIVPPVPSLFTFNCKDKKLHPLAGISLNAHIELLDREQKPLKSGLHTSLQNDLSGALLITHWGFSGPAILKLSSIMARRLHELNYQFLIRINWLPSLSEKELKQQLFSLKSQYSKKNINNTPLKGIPKKLWQYLLEKSKISLDMNWADIRKEQLLTLIEKLQKNIYSIEGKSTFKEEFVTAGGVELKEIDFKTFGSKLFPTLYITGEALNIDAVTGGFNFQNAWTSGYLAARALW